MQFSCSLFLNIITFVIHFITLFISQEKYVRNSVGLLLILGLLAQPHTLGKCLVLLQLDILCFVDIHGRPALS